MADGSVCAGQLKECPFSARVETSASPTPRLLDHIFCIKFGIWPESIGCGLYRLLFARRIGSQGMLDAVAKLRQNRIGNIKRVLGHEINADPFGADELDNLLDFFDQHFRGFIKQQMCLVKEEDKTRLVGVTNFRQFLEEF